jgi:hypothetical protein
MPNRMNQITIEIPSRVWFSPKTYSRSLAGQWTDMDDSLRLFCLRELLMQAEIPAKVKILKRLLKLPKTVFLALSDEQMSALLDTLSWLNLEGSDVPIVKTFMHKGETWALPKAKFEDGRAVEFPTADQYLDVFTKSGNESDLLKLVGTLAAPVDKKGKRIPILNKEDAEHRADLLRGLPSEISMSVLLYFVGVKQYISKTYGRFLFEPEDDEDDTPSVATAHFPQFGWWGSYLGIAESGVFGNYEQVLRTNFHRIAMFLIEKRKESKRMQEQYKKQNPH